MKKICRKESWESSCHYETGGESLTDLAGQLIQVWYSAVQYLETRGSVPVDSSRPGEVPGHQPPQQPGRH